MGAGMACVDQALRRLQGVFSASPNDTSFQNATDIDNRRARVQPLVVVWPVSDADVALAIRAAQRCRLSFSVVSGGHGAAGYQLAKGGLTLSMERMAAVSVNAQSGEMVVQPGARFGDIYRAVVESPEWIPVGGGCPRVAPGGYYTGGGWSFLSRSYGLAIDTLLSVTTVLANGTIAVANGSSRCTSACRDLWWASRGGGGGNFGVVTQYRVRLQHAPREILVGQLCWAADLGALGEVWQWLLDAYPTMPSWLQIDPAWLPLGVNRTRLFCYTVICNNEDEAACRELVRPVANQPDIVLDTLQMRSFLSWQLEHGSVTAAQHGYLYLSNFVMQDGVVSAERIQRLQRAVLTSPSPRNLVLFHMGGGKVAEIGEAATAFPHRRAQFVLQVKAIWDDDNQVTRTENMAWVASLKAWLTPLASGSYVNYVDPLLADWERMYYSTNYARLRAVKAALDPRNFFSFNQSIRPAPAGFDTNGHSRGGMWTDGSLETSGNVRASSISSSAQAN